MALKRVMIDGRVAHILGVDLAVQFPALNWLFLSKSMPSDYLNIRKLKLRIIFLPDQYRPTLQHLNNARTKMVTGGVLAETYEGSKSLFAGMLAREIAHEIPDLDAILVPKSSRDDVQPYLAKVSELKPGLRILSPRMTRKNRLKAISATSFASVIREFEYLPDGAEGSIKSLLILDDIVGTGRTSLAMLYHLCKAGLAKDCQITIATPLWTTKGKTAT